MNSTPALILSHIYMYHLKPNSHHFSLKVFFFYSIWLLFFFRISRIIFKSLRILHEDEEAKKKCESHNKFPSFSSNMIFFFYIFAFTFYLIFHLIFHILEKPVCNSIFDKKKWVLKLNLTQLTKIVSKFQQSACHKCMYYCMCAYKRVMRYYIGIGIRHSGNMTFSLSLIFILLKKKFYSKNAMTRIDYEDEDDDKDHKKRWQ